MSDPPDTVPTVTLASFQTRFGDRTLVEHAGMHPSSVGDLTLPAANVATRPIIQARVNAGRWIGDCPDPDCAGAEYVHLDEPALFCCECRNAGTAQYRAIKVQLPDATTMAAIEQTLLVRPVPATRNWEPGETVDDLLRENEDHNLDGTNVATPH